MAFHHPKCLLDQKLAEIIGKTEYFSNFIVGEHSGSLLWFVFVSPKITTNPANHQIINQLYFVELTLKYKANEISKLKNLFITMLMFAINTTNVD